MKKAIIHFAHANGFPGGTYNRMLSFFGDDYNVIAIDRIGHNDSFKIENNWSGLADELIDNIEKRAENPVIGLGHSLGSIVTFMAAYRRPELFKCVIMLDPVFFLGLKGMVFHLLKVTGTADYFSPAGKSKGRLNYWSSLDEVKKYLRSRNLFSRINPKSLDDYITHGFEKCGDGYSLRYNVDREVKIFQTMPDNIDSYKKRLAVPGALIHGSHSRSVHVSSLKKFVRTHQMDFDTSPGGHLFPLERPAETAKTISNKIQLLLNNHP